MQADLGCLEALPVPSARSPLLPKKALYAFRQAAETVRLGTQWLRILSAPRA